MHNNDYWHFYYASFVGVAKVRLGENLVGLESDAFYRIEAPKRKFNVVRTPLTTLSRALYIYSVYIRKKLKIKALYILLLILI